MRVSSRLFMVMLFFSIRCFRVTPLCLLFCWLEASMGRPAACLLNRSLIETQTVSASIISPILIFEEAAALGRIQLKLAVEVVMSRLRRSLARGLPLLDFSKLLLHLLYALWILVL